MRAVQLSHKHSAPPWWRRSGHRRRVGERARPPSHKILCTKPGNRGFSLRAITSCPGGRGFLGARVCDVWTRDADLPWIKQRGQDVGDVTTGRGGAKSTSTRPGEMQNLLHGAEAKVEPARVTRQKTSLIVIIKVETPRPYGGLRGARDILLLALALWSHLLLPLPTRAGVSRRGLLALPQKAKLAPTSGPLHMPFPLPAP